MWTHVLRSSYVLALLYSCVISTTNIIALHKNFPLPWPNNPYWGRVSSLSRLHDPPQAHRSRLDSSGKVINPTQRPVPDNTHNRQTPVHPVGCEPTISSRLAAADPRLRPRGHWDRPYYIYRDQHNTRNRLIKHPFVTCTESRVSTLHYHHRCFLHQNMIGSRLWVYYFILQYYVWNYPIKETIPSKRFYEIFMFFHSSSIPHHAKFVRLVQLNLQFSNFLSVSRRGGGGVLSRKINNDGEATLSFSNPSREQKPYTTNVVVIVFSRPFHLHFSRQDV